MRKSKIFMLAAIFSFAIAGAWIVGGHPANAQKNPTATPTPSGTPAQVLGTSPPGGSTTRPSPWPKPPPPPKPGPHPAPNPH
jgi:hypothetical protein